MSLNKTDLPHDASIFQKVLALSRHDKKLFIGSEINQTNYKVKRGANIQNTLSSSIDCAMFITFSRSQGTN